MQMRKYPIGTHDRSYAFPYQSDGRRVVKVGVKFNKENRVPEEWAWGVA